VPVGGGKLISAVDEAIVGMHVGGKRRVLVRPDRDQGWKKSDPNCASLFDVGMASGIPGAVIAKVSHKQQHLINCYSSKALHAEVLAACVGAGSHRSMCRTLV
jgi:hypothetical protein